MEIMRDYYYSDIILHIDGTVTDDAVEENIQVYHSNIVLLLTGVVREKLEAVMDDENILNSNLVRELGKVTRTELTSDEVKIKNKIETFVLLFVFNWTKSGYDSGDDKQLEQTRPKLREQQLERCLVKKPNPTNNSFNRPPSGYKKNKQNPKYRSFSSTPSPRTLQRFIKSWQHNFMGCPVCKTNKIPLLSSAEYFC